MQEIAAYLTFVLASVALIFSIAAAIGLTIAISELSKWVRRICFGVRWHRHTEELSVRV